MVELLPCHTVTVEFRGVAVPPSEVPSCGFTHLINAPGAWTRHKQKDSDKVMRCRARRSKRQMASSSVEWDEAKHGSLRSSEVTRSRTAWVSMKMRSKAESCAQCL